MEVSNLKSCAGELLTVYLLMLRNLSAWETLNIFTNDLLK